MPKDPWGNDYQYRSPGEHGEYDVYSFGRDGRPGGEGEDAHQRRPLPASELPQRAVQHQQRHEHR